MNTVIHDIFSVYEYSTERLSWKNIGGRKYHIISYQVSGCYEHTVNGRVLSVGPGALFFINKDDSYSVRCVEQGYSLCVCFLADTDLETTVYDAENDARVENIFKRIMLASAIEQDSNKYTVAARIYELLALIASRKAASYVPSSSRDGVRLAHSYILDNYRSKDFNASELSATCGVGKKQFVNLFRNEYGSSPTQYVIQLRMSTAARLIEEGHMSVSEVAEFVGYEDVFYFSRLFKKHFSVSPSRYRMRKLSRN